LLKKKERKKKNIIGGKGEKGIGESRPQKKKKIQTPDPTPFWGAETSALSQQFERKQKIAKWDKI
jgi:hypothetical protein